MSVKLSDRQSQAVAILAIATAAIGFGLFGVDLDLKVPSAENPEIASKFIANLLCILTALGFYFAVFLTSGRILAQNQSVPGHQLVRGPLNWMYWEMVSLALIFLAKLFL